MTDEIIYSKTYDKKLKDNLANSPIWKDAYKKEELESTKGYYKYSVRFNGLKPVQLLKVEKIKS